jgi:hypothetical protein
MHLGGVVLLTIYHQVDQIMTNEMGGICGIMWERRDGYSIFIGKTWVKETTYKT